VDVNLSLEPRAGLAKKISWRKCQLPDLNRVQCGRYAVPQDYSKPNGPKFKLKVWRLKALPKKQRGGNPIKGSLFANPGGPGYSGVNLLYGLTEFRKRFHVVTWAPRGVSKSKPLLRDCPADPNTTFSSDFPLTGPFTWQQMAKVKLNLSGPSNAFCFGNSARLVTKIGTNNVVRDLDALRAAVGDSALTYLGYSYGTRIGRLYAQTYPNRVRAMVLDGVVDPTETMEDFAVLGSKGGKASFGYTKRAMTKGEFRAYKNVDAALQSDSGPGLNRFIWWQFALNAGNDPEIFDQLTLASCQLAAQLNVPGCSGVTATKRSLSGALRKLKKEQRRLTRESALTQLINCVDLRGRPSPAKIGQYLDGAVKTNLAGQVGRINGLTYGSTCLGTPLPPDPVPALPNGLRMPHPPLLVNGKGDASTPYIGAKRTHKHITGSRLITVNTSRHGIFRGKQRTSACIVKPVMKYLTSQRLPAKNKYCKRAYR